MTTHLYFIVWRRLYFTCIMAFTCKLLSIISCRNSNKLFSSLSMFVGPTKKTTNQWWIWKQRARRKPLQKFTRTKFATTKNLTFLLVRFFPTFLSFAVCRVKICLARVYALTTSIINKLTEQRQCYCSTSVQYVVRQIIIQRNVKIRNWTNIGVRSDAINTCMLEHTST